MNYGDMGHVRPPYDDHECRHERRSEHRGVLRCLDCGWVYDECSLTWVPESSDDDD
jgi:succinate dehydrogenase/fumarate reductase-like Fe-S protein